MLCRSSRRLMLQAEEIQATVPAGLKLAEKRGETSRT
jgi:hypothetical protein